MKKPHKREQQIKYCQIIYVILFSGMLTGCFQKKNINSEYEINRETKVFAINSVIILKELEQGEMDIVSLMDTTEEIFPSAENAVFWVQEDYLKIARAFHQQLWKEPLESHVYKMTFSLDCADVEKGAFSYARFDSHQYYQEYGGENRIEYSIWIYPSGNYVYTSKAEYRFSPGIVEPIDLEVYQVTADAALQIAEESGGAVKRFERDNECRIDVTARGDGEKVWIITYYNNPIRFLYEIVIDSQTGSIR